MEVGGGYGAAMARGPYAKTAKQRDEITRRALEHFGRFGYHGASMREIARAVGLSQAGLLHHFKTKADLLMATLESRDIDTGALARAAIADSGNPLAGMVAVVEDNARQRHLVQLFTVVSAEATDPDHPAHGFFTERAATVIGHFHRALTTAVERGAAPADLDVDAAARRCQAMMYGLQVQWLFDPSVDLVGDFRAFLDDLVSD